MVNRVLVKKRQPYEMQQWILFNRPKLEKHLGPATALLLNMIRTTLPRFTDPNNHHNKITLAWVEGSPRNQQEPVSSGWVWRSMLFTQTWPNNTSYRNQIKNSHRENLWEASHLTSWCPPRPASKERRKTNTALVPLIDNTESISVRHLNTEMNRVVVKHWTFLWPIW